MTDIIARALALNAKGLAKAIADLAAQGLTYKGAVEKTTDLPVSPTIGDTYYVAEEGSSYVWTEYKGTEQWLPLSKEGKRGPAGEDGNGIVSITKTSTVGLVDTYTITFTNGTTTTFTVTNGSGNWGSIQGTLTDQQDLVQALNGKVSDVTIGGTSIVSSGVANIPKTTAGDIDSGNATSGKVLTADGSGGASWQTAGGGGTTLNKYTYAFNKTTFSFSRLANILNNAKGRINLQALNNYMSSSQGSMVDDGTTVQIIFIFDVIGEDIGRFILGFMDGAFMAKMLTWLASGNDIEDVTSEINSMTITYFNDTEITQ